MKIRAKRTNDESASWDIIFTVETERDVLDLWKAFNLPLEKYLDALCGIKKGRTSPGETVTKHRQT